MLVPLNELTGHLKGSLTANKRGRQCLLTVVAKVVAPERLFVTS